MPRPEGLYHGPLFETHMRTTERIPQAADSLSSYLDRSQELWATMFRGLPPNANEPMAARTRALSSTAGSPQTP